MNRFRPVAAVIIAFFAFVARKAVACRDAVVRTVRRLPVSYAAYAALKDDIGILERHALDLAGRIGDRDKRVRSYLDLARVFDQIRRSPEFALRALVKELRGVPQGTDAPTVDPHWSMRADRIFLAARLSCSAAGLGAIRGCDEVSRDAYLLGQTFYGKVVDADRKIGLAVAFSEAARLMGSVGDQASWLASAMELACDIREREGRLGAIAYVAEKMVEAGLPPPVAPPVRERFAVDATPRAVMVLAESSSSDPELHFEL